MDTEKVNEFKNYLQEVISGNTPGVLGSRAVLNNAPSKKISTITGVLNIPQDEEIIIFFDDTLMGSGKEGLVLTSWGIHYNISAKWDISWEEIAEKFSFFAIEGTNDLKKFKIRNGQGDDFSIEKEIYLSMASFELEWLKRILIRGCRIFTGKNIGKEEEVSPPVPVNDIPSKEAAQPETSSESTARASGEGVIVYKDKLMLFVVPAIIAIAPFFTIFAIVNDATDIGTSLFSIILCVIFMIVFIHFHKYNRGGIILDLDARIISFPKLVLFKPGPFPRNDISFDDITGIEATDSIQFERSYGNLKTDVSGNLVTTKTYNFIILGTFGSKKVSFRNRETRDQFYSLLKTYGNFK